MALNLTLARRRAIKRGVGVPPEDYVAPEAWTFPENCVYKITEKNRQAKKQKR